MPAWPATVPFFIAHGGLSRSGQDGAVIRSSMDYGPDKVRRRTTAAVKVFNGITPFLTKTQFQALETFFESDLVSGSLSFTATDPLECDTKTYRFVGTYRVQPSGRAFRVSAQLEILP